MSGAGVTSPRAAMAAPASRWLVGGLAAVTLSAGLASRSGLLPAGWAKPVGVALWCALVYWLVLLARPRLSAWRVFLVSVLVACAVECLQLTPLPARLAESVPASRWVLGTTFSGPDFGFYFVGAVLAAAAHLYLVRDAHPTIPSARRLGTALLLGVCTTVATGWVAMRLPADNGWFGPHCNTSLGLARAPDGKYWQLSRGDHPVHSVVTYWFVQVSGRAIWMSEEDFEESRYDWRRLARRDRPRELTDLNMMAWYHTTGWPFRSLSCSVHWERQIRNSDITYSVRGGVQLPRDADFNPRAVPFTPVWPGFVFNSLIFGAVWLVFLTAAAAVRDRYRRGLGRCIRCLYPRAGLARGALCPECGFADALERPGS